MEFEIGGKIVKLNALVDSGNLLKEPSTDKPVVIVEKECLKEVFNDYFFNKKNNRKFFIIPYSSLGNDNGVLIGILCEVLKVYWNEEVYISDVIIGIYNGKLCSSNKYRGLIGMELLSV